MKTFESTSFREYCDKFLYIENAELAELILGESYDDETGFVAYCFIDPELGISFRVLYKAWLSNVSLHIEMMPNAEDTIYLIRMRGKDSYLDKIQVEDTNLCVYSLDYKKTEFFDVERIGFDVSSLSGLKEEMVEIYNKVGDVVKLRDDTSLDRYRDEYRPDDVYVFIVDEQESVYRAWARMMGMSDSGRIYGRLIHNLHSKSPYKKDDFIEFESTEYGLIVSAGANG